MLSESSHLSALFTLAVVSGWSTRCFLGWSPLGADPEIRTQMQVAYLGGGKGVTPESTVGEWRSKTGRELTKRVS